jgi:hypothetical protein
MVISIFEGLVVPPEIEPFLQHAFTRQEVVNLPYFRCLARLNINNEPATPFIFKSTP